MKIRAATAQDIGGIAYVHATSWKTTYRGLLPQDFLDRITPEGRTPQWERTLAASNREICILVAEDADGRIVGFLSAGPCREKEAPLDSFDAELYALYILEPYQRTGTGSRLVRCAAGELTARGHRSMLAWVLTDNPATGFYQAIGGKAFAHKEIEIGGEPLQETAMGWIDMTTITGNAG